MVKKFLKQNLEYHMWKQKPLAAEQKQSHSVHNMSNDFEKIVWAIREKEITKLDKWYSDETGY